MTSGVDFAFHPNRRASPSFLRETVWDQQPEVGDYFTECLASHIDSLSLYGGIHEQYRGFHRALSKRFPFVIYYKENGDCVEISTAAKILRKRMKASTLFSPCRNLGIPTCPVVFDRELL